MSIHENSLQCSRPFDYDAIDEHEAPTRRREQQAATADAMETVRRVISFIRTKPRCRVTVDCLFLALGDAELEAATMTSVAKANGLTKAAISKRTKEIRHQLHLGVNANNKTEHASRRYAETNRSPLRLGKPSSK